jgi:predicted Zn-dependent protease
MRRRRSSHAFALLALCAAVAGCGTLSVDKEKELGAELAQEMRKELRFVRETVVVDYVQSIGRSLVSAAGPQPFPYHFYVVDDEQLNAFAMPAGHVYVQTGIILNAANVSELAGVMAHEVGHVALRHIAQNYNKQRGAGILYNIGAIATSIFLPGPAAYGSQVLGQLAIVSALNTFTREAEREADAFAVRVMPQAGLDPEGLVTFFQTLEQETAQSGGSHPPAFLSTHPATEERIATTSKLIQEAKLPEHLRRTDNGKLEIIQRRIRLLTRTQ